MFHQHHIGTPHVSIVKLCVVQFPQRTLDIVKYHPGQIAGFKFIYRHYDNRRTPSPPLLNNNATWVRDTRRRVPYEAVRRIALVLGKKQ
jgi:hypothetical protein